VLLLLVLELIYTLSNFKLRTLPVSPRCFNILILMRFISVEDINLKLLINHIKIKTLKKGQRNDTTGYVLKLKYDSMAKFTLILKVTTQSWFY